MGSLCFVFSPGSREQLGSAVGHVPRDVCLPSDFRKMVSGVTAAPWAEWNLEPDPSVLWWVALTWWGETSGGSSPNV